MSTISASTLTTTAFQIAADTTGALVFQTGATPTTALTLAADQSATFTGTVNFATAGFTNLSYTGTLTGGTGVVNIGSGQFYKDASGNVGIGTNAPPTFANYTYLNVNGVTNSYLKLTNTASGNTTSDGFDVAISGLDGYLINREAGNMLFYNNGSERMRIDSSGNVGIGTSSPTRRLHLAAPTTCDMTIQCGNTTDYSYLYFGDSASATQGWVGYYNTEDSMRFGVNGSEKMRIPSGGGLLVGATTSTFGASLGYMAGFKGTASQSYISISRSGTNLDSDGMIVGVDTGTANILVRENIPLDFYINNAFKMRLNSSGQLLNASARPMLNQTGGILQVVSVTSTSQATYTRATYMTPWSLTITPSSTSSQIMVKLNMSVGASSASDIGIIVYRGATALQQGTGASNTTATWIPAMNIGSGDLIQATWFLIDSPATTSPVTYSFMCAINANTMYVNRRAADASFTGSSMAMLMEIAG